MKINAIFIAALAACASGVIGAYIAPNVYVDVYRNTLSPQARINNGVIVTKAIPYQVSIQWNAIGIHSHICGGALFDGKWVLTAGHCKPYSIGTYRVQAGQLKLDLAETSKGTEVENFEVHEKHELDVNNIPINDIALIKLKEPISGPNPLKLPDGTECTDDTSVTGNLAGWGGDAKHSSLSKDLKSVEVPRISAAECNKLLETFFPGNNFLNDENMICTGPNEDKHESACSGDSGSPLVISDPNKQIVIGITSWTISPCKTHEVPTVYTNVCEYTDWIEETKSKLDPLPPPPPPQPPVDPEDL